MGRRFAQIVADWVLILDICVYLRPNNSLDLNPSIRVLYVHCWKALSENPDEEVKSVLLFGKHKSKKSRLNRRISLQFDDTIVNLHLSWIKMIPRRTNR